MSSMRIEVKQTFSFALVVIMGLYCVALTVSNIIAGKLFVGPLGLILPAGVWLFPVVYIIADIVPEVYGLGVARRVIWVGFGANALAVFFFALTLVLPAPGFFENQKAFEIVLGFTPRLLVASFAAYLVGTNVNAWILVIVKQWTGGRYLWVRTISSTIVAETLDSLIFVLIAFWGIVPADQLPLIILSQATLKTLYEVVATPLTYLVVNAFKMYEYGTVKA